MDNSRKEQLLKNYFANMIDMVNDVKLDQNGITVVAGIMEEVTEALKNENYDKLEDILESKNEN